MCEMSVRKTWNKWGADPDKTSPMEVEVNGEADYGFRVVIVGNNAASLTALLCKKPEEIDRTRDCAATGTVVWLLAFIPHATTVPSDFSARLWNPPASTETTSVSPPGGVA